jgi:hypothetical protein
MPADSRSSFSLSRRAILGAASAAPVAMGAKTADARATVDRCGQWLEADAEIDRLCVQWANLDHGAGDERESLEARLEHLHQGQVRGLEGIADMKAHDLRAVVGKLAVVASATREDGGPIHDIVIDALRVLIGEASRKI